MILAPVIVAIIIFGFFGLKIYHKYKGSQRPVRPNPPQPKWTQFICRRIE